MADEHERQKRGFSANGTDEQVGTRWARASNDQSKSDETARIRRRRTR